MSAVRQRSPTKPKGGKGKVAEKAEAVPVYTQEELDRDLVNPNMWLMIYERSVVVLGAIAMAIYLYWRVNNFMTKPSDYYISIPLLLSETALILPGLGISYFIIWHRIHRPAKRIADMNLTDAELPTVDLMMPCLNEPADIIERTLNSLVAIDYPKKKMTICICDDGAREEIKKLGEKIEAAEKSKGSDITIRYFARKKVKGVYHHAKAGNLNNAILQEGTSGQFIAVFDCDMVAEPHFLSAILPHFYNRTESGYVVDEKLALVQSPQSFTNVPAYDPLGQQYKYFYGPVLQGWDGADACPCCGTNVIFSRKNLTAIGGFVYGSVTEDFLTSMYLHNAGYKSKYIHEYLARGLAPETLHDFMKQRLRWSAGAVEIFFFHNSIWRTGLTWKQTYLYFWAGLQAILAYNLLLVCIVPFVPLIWPNVRISPQDAGEYIYYMGAFMFFNIWMLFVSYRDVPKLYLKRSIQESVFMLGNKVEAVLQVAFKGKMTFSVTKKGEQSALRKDLGHAFPHFLYYFVALAAIGKVIFNAIQPSVTKERVVAEMVSLIWISIVCWQVWPPISMILYSLRMRREESKKSKSPKLPSP